MNASLALIQSGLKPSHGIKFTDGTVHYVFSNGQHRREIGEGHSKTERNARREKKRADYALRREYKRGRSDQ